jgi:hypothetical protein
MSTFDPNLDQYMQKVREVMFNKCQPNFKEAPDVVQAVS